MNSTDITNLEHASRSAMAWWPEGYDGRTHYDRVLLAAVPAFGIVAVATALLLNLF